MYFVLVILLMLVLPLASAGIERYAGHIGMGLPILIERWLVFFGASVSDSPSQEYVRSQNRSSQRKRSSASRARSLRLSYPNSGLRNTAIGIVGVGSVLHPSWLTSAAVAGCVFYALAGINHIRHRHRTRLQNIAMVSDVLLLASWLR